MKRIFAIAAPAAMLAMSAGAQDNGALADKMKAEIQMAMEKMKVAGVGGGVMGRVVKGAPYSGQEINESNQVLADGTRIRNETRTTVYRDGEGRVRRESGDTVTIWDPVGNVSYTLNPKSMTAIKSGMAPAVFMRQPMMVTSTAAAGAHGFAGVGGAGSAGFSVQDGMIVITRDGKTERFPMPADGNWTSDDGKIHAIIRQTMDAAGGQHTSFSVKEGQITITENGQTRTMPLPPSGSTGGGTLTRIPISPDTAVARALDEAKLKKSMAAGNTQDLGEQIIEGVKGRGTRTINTIEAGAIGNDRPLTTVAERWYSDELQTEILNKRTDPRTGESTFRLININRGEPGLYLFQVPSGYTVNERK